MDTKSDQTAAPLNNADILAQLIGDKRSTFWLGHYSENEVLHLLAKFDILPVLKAKGCDHPLIIIEPLEAFEQALKIFNSTVTTENLFVELRLHETSFSHPNLLGGAPQPMLKIDWLMLQNPAAVFSAEQPALPGQRHPGLGLAKRTLQLLVYLAQRDQLTGVLNFPQFFHNAYLYLEHFRYCNPELKGLVLALRRDLCFLSLAELSWAIYLGCIFDEAAGKVCEWQADALVLPLEETVSQCFSSPEYEQIVFTTMAVKKFVLQKEKFQLLYAAQPGVS